MMTMLLLASTAQAQGITEAEALQRKDQANMDNAEAFMAVDEATQAYQFALSLKAATTEQYNAGPDGLGGNWGINDVFILNWMTTGNASLDKVSQPVDYFQQLHDPTLDPPPALPRWPIGKVPRSDIQLMSAELNWNAEDWTQCAFDAQASSSSSNAAVNIANVIKSWSDAAAADYFEAAILMQFGQ